MSYVHDDASSLSLSPSKVIVIAGGFSRDNETLARGLTRLGATVVWPLPAHAASQLGADANLLRRGANARLHVPALDVRGSGDLHALLDLCRRRFAGVDAVVANFGDHDGRPRLVEVSEQDCSDAINGRLLPHILLSRAFMPLLARRPDSAYIFINDGNAGSPTRGGSLRCATSAAELALAGSLAFEMGGHPSVHSLVIGGPSSLGLLTPETLAEAVALIVKHPDFAKDQVVIESQWRERLDPEAQRGAVSTGI